MTDAIAEIENLLTHIEGVSDERDSVPILTGLRERWPAVKAELDRLNARIDDLLATNGRYLEEARQARRERDALLQGFRGIATAISVMPEVK